jgi:hypothetical protein
MRYLVICCILFALSACQGVTADETNLQLQSELDAYGTEGAVLRQEIQLNQTEIVATVAASGTDAAAYASYNRILAPTVGVVQPGTPTRIPAEEVIQALGVEAQGPMPVEMFDISDGQTRFVQLGTAGQIDNENCFISHQSFFQSSSNVIYMTGLGLNVFAGTSLRVEWRFGGELVHTSTWSAPQSVDGQCVALAMRPSNAALTPGNWTATMFVNGEPIDPAPFTIVSSGM